MRSSLIAILVFVLPALVSSQSIISTSSVSVAETPTPTQAPIDYYSSYVAGLDQSLVSSWASVDGTAPLPTTTSDNGLSSFFSSEGWVQGLSTTTVITEEGGLVETVIGPVPSVPVKTSSSGLSSSQKLAIGLGVSLGAITIFGAIVGALLVRHRRRQQKQDFARRTVGLRAMSQTIDLP